MKTLFAFLSCLLFLQACSTTVNINAPKKDIWVVYAVLDQSKQEQFIRVSRGFLPEGNAVTYAKENDLSAKGLIVRLSGGGREYEAVEVDNVPKDPQDGNFFPFTSLYKIQTEGTEALKEGERYNLEITRPDDSEFFIRSHTVIPNNASFPQPTTVPGGGRSRCLKQVTLDGEFKLEFGRGNASAFEIRAFLDYEQNGTPMTATYGPTTVFAENFRCQTPGNSTICYNFREKVVLQALFNDLNPDPTQVYTYGIREDTRCNAEADKLPRAFRFEVTAIDSALYNYQLVNDPRFQDFSSVKPEFTNIEGSENLALGLFGSISVNEAFYQLNPCTEFLLQLNEREAPASPCSL